MNAQIVPGITGKNYIGFTTSSKGSNTFTTFNPRQNKENPEIFTEASSDEINEAVSLANKAFETYKTITGIEKTSFLNAIADELLALGDVLIDTYCKESGLPEGRAKGERGRTVNQLRKFADLVEEGSWVEAIIDTADPDRNPAPKPDLRKMMIPLGPVVIFGASNFPLAFSTAGGDTASALAAGCPVIVKSHPMHAGTGELVAYAINSAAEKTGMPDGVFSNLNSSGIEVGVQLVEHPDIKAVGFTGSLKGGKALYALAANRKEPIPVFAEMGSVNPVILLPEALNERAEEIAKTYARSITLGAGQFCTNPGLLVTIASSQTTDFINQLGKEIMEIVPSVMLHPSIAENYTTTKDLVLEQPQVDTLVQYTDAIEKNYGRQALATLSGKEFLANKTVHQEVFGPFSLIVTCANMKEMTHIISQLEGQLTGTILAEPSELENHQLLIETLQQKVGRLIYNGAPTGVEVCAAMVHGGPFPASTDSRFTSVGTQSIKRWVRPFSYQNWPNPLLPDALKDGNPLKILREVDGNQTYDSV